MKMGVDARPSHVPHMQAGGVRVMGGVKATEAMTLTEVHPLRVERQ